MTSTSQAELIERETPYGLLQRAHLLQGRRHHAQAAVLLERAQRLEPGKASIPPGGGPRAGVRPLSKCPGASRPKAPVPVLGLRAAAMYLYLPFYT
jgi:hypothetical protein